MLFHFFLVFVFSKRKLVVDFGSKYLKGGIIDENGKFTQLNENLSMSSISASIDDFIKTNATLDSIKIGKSAYEKSLQNEYFGIEFFGAVFSNENKSYLSENHLLYHFDKNVTLSDYPLFWYMSKFLLKLKEHTKTDSLFMILPGFHTQRTFDLIQLANANITSNYTLVDSFNETFDDITIVTDYNLISANQKRISPSKASLFIDVGAFSSKATLIANGNIQQYIFCEDCGVERVAFRLADKENISRIDAYEKMKSSDFNDENFSINFEAKIINQFQKSEFFEQVKEIVVFGGGSEFGFIRQVLGKFRVPFTVANDPNNYLVNLLLDNFQNVNCFPNFDLHPKFLAYNNNSITTITKGQEIGVYKSKRLNITTSSEAIIKGNSNVLFEIEIIDDEEPDNESILYIGDVDTTNDLNSTIILNITTDKGKIFNTRRTNSSLIQFRNANVKKSSETDAAMAMLKVLFANIPKKKVQNDEL